MATLRRPSAAVRPMGDYFGGVSSRSGRPLKDAGRDFLQAAGPLAPFNALTARHAIRSELLRRRLIRTDTLGRTLTNGYHR